MFIVTISPRTQTSQAILAPVAVYCPTPRQTAPPKSPPAPLSYSSVAALTSVDTLRQAPVVVVLLNASDSRVRGLSPTSIPAGVIAFRGTPENVGRQGLRQVIGSIYWQAAPRGECCNKSGHGSGRRRGACAWPHEQKVNAPQRNFCCKAGCGTGGTRERQADCCAEVEDALHESSSDDATSVARRRPFCCSSGSHSPRRLGQDFVGRQDDHAEKDLEENQRGSEQDALTCRCALEEELLGRRPQWHERGKATVRFEAAWCLITTRAAGV